MANYIIGVDAGGSKTHALLLNEQGQTIAESISGPANISKNVDLAYTSITDAISQLLTHYGKLPFKLGVGVAGYSATVNREELQRRLHEKYAGCILHSDCHIACLAAHKGGNGAVLICGTGVVGYAIKGEHSFQLGGWGFPHGDLGGGAWLGLEVCKLVCKAADGVIAWSPLLKAVYSKFNQDYTKYKTWLLSATPGDFAAIARLSFITEFLVNDSNAREIFDRGIAEVTQYLEIIEKRSLPIKLVGGLASFYLKTLRYDFPELNLSEVNPAIGAAYLVMKE